MRKILITGFAGFIGYNLVEHLRQTYEIIALDNYSSFSNHEIKLERARQLGMTNDLSAGTFTKAGNVTFYNADLCNREEIEKIFSAHSFSCIIHLAALTGVRQSLQHPQAYIQVNVTGFVNLLEVARKYDVKNIIYASSSSVYGLNKEAPYSEEHFTDSPISAYAASKKAAELMASVHAHLYGASTTGLRFFTVYGPWTRPDMAAYIFMKAIRDGKPIELFNKGQMIRDFTYVDDVVKAIELLIEMKTAQNLPGNTLFNIGNHKPIAVIDFLHTIEDAMGKKAIIISKPLQPGDMPATHAAVDKLKNFLGFQPATTMQDGVAHMVEWFKEFGKQ